MSPSPPPLRSAAPSGAPAHAATSPVPPSSSPAPSGALPSFKRPFRLSRQTYAAGCCFSVTIVTSGRRPFFLTSAYTKVALASLRESALRFSASIYAYCFMPDHLHLLAATPAGTRFDEFVRHFKQVSSYRLKGEAHVSKLWQPSYYDHALRSGEVAASVAEYILNNPVRAGLIENAMEYPHSGSFNEI